MGFCRLRWVLVWSLPPCRMVFPRVYFSIPDPGQIHYSCFFPENCCVCVRYACRFFNCKGFECRQSAWPGKEGFPLCHRKMLHLIMDSSPVEKSGCVLCEGVPARYAVMKSSRLHYPASLMARVFDVSVSGYHAWDERLPSQRAQEDARVSVAIRAAHRMTKDWVGRALFQAFTAKRLAPGLIHHSDRGSQYCSHDYQ